MPSHWHLRQRQRYACQCIPRPWCCEKGIEFGWHWPVSDRLAWFGISFAIGDGYIVLTLWHSKRVREKVKGEEVAWIIAALLVFAAIRGIASSSSALSQIGATSAPVTPQVTDAPSGHAEFCEKATYA